MESAARFVAGVRFRVRVRFDMRGLLLLKSGYKADSADDLDQCYARFSRLRSETALKTIQFYRLRERSVSAWAEAVHLCVLSGCSIFMQDDLRRCAVTGGGGSCDDSAGPKKKK